MIIHFTFYLFLLNFIFPLYPMKIEFNHNSNSLAVLFNYNQVQIYNLVGEHMKTIKLEDDIDCMCYVNSNYLILISNYDLYLYDHLYDLTLLKI